MELGVESGIGHQTLTFCWGFGQYHVEADMNEATDGVKFISRLLGYFLPAADLHQFRLLRSLHERVAGSQSIHGKGMRFYLLIILLTT